jgi:hypothetical protein
VIAFQAPKLAFLQILVIAASKSLSKGKFSVMLKTAITCQALRIGLARKIPVVASGLRARLFHLLASQFQPSLELLLCGFMEKKLVCPVKLHCPRSEKAGSFPAKVGDNEGWGWARLQGPGT